MNTPVEWVRFRSSALILLRLQTLIQFSLYRSQQSWRKMTEDVHCPARQPEDHNREEDPSFCEDLDVYIEFDDGVFYQASLDASEVAMTTDYPRLYPLCIMSIRRLLKRRSLSASLPDVLTQILTGSAL